MRDFHSLADQFHIQQVERDVKAARERQAGTKLYHRSVFTAVILSLALIVFIPVALL